MDNRSELLMLHGVTRMCPDCGEESVFVPVEQGRDADACELCCTACDTAVFLVPVQEYAGRVPGRVA